jgi:hypothetical protein
MVMTKASRGVAVKNLYGGRFIAPKVVAHSMAGLEGRLTAEFNERTKRREEFAEQVRKLRSPFLEVFSKDQHAADAISGLRRLRAAARSRKPPTPHRAKAAERIFAGSIGATQVPPYDYQWTWSAVNGVPQTNIETADQKSGNMSIDLWTGDDSNSISAAAAVGIYFFPPAANGSLQIASFPSFADTWGDSCNWDSASADGWIGLYVGSYDLTGAPTGAVLEQQVSLWSDSSWWGGVGSQYGSNSAFPLYASQMQVDQDHQYIIWVWMGGDVYGAGDMDPFGSFAWDQMNVAVPTITWVFG